MNQNESWTLSIVRELTEMSVEDLREFWPCWDETMKEMGFPDWARDFGRTAVELVIEKKLEKRKVGKREVSC